MLATRNNETYPLENWGINQQHYINEIIDFYANLETLDSNNYVDVSDMNKEYVYAEKYFLLFWLIHKETVLRLSPSMNSNQMTISQTALWIWKVGTPVIFTIGVSGNVATICTLLREVRKSSTTIYLLGLAISDLVIVLNISRWWLVYMFGVDIRLLSQFLCQLNFFISHVTAVSSALILVAVTIDRTIITVQEFKTNPSDRSKYYYVTCKYIFDYCLRKPVERW